MKILVLDIETAPHSAYVWGLWDENIPLARLRAAGYTLCWSAKWYGEKEVFFDSVYNGNSMLKRIHKLMDEADAIVHYNGNRFDIPILHKEFILAGMAPPSPSKHIDLLTVARRQFKFASNKLEFVARELGLGEKKNTTFETWVGCMEGDPKSWEIMERYNKHDVKLTEKVYVEFKPWIKNHPNHALYGAGGEVCPTCGGNHYNRRGYAFTKAGKYQRFQCTACGTWFRSGRNESNTKSTERFTGV